MRKFLLLLCAFPAALQAQRFHVDLAGGLSNYTGDLQEKTFTTQQSKPAAGIGLRYDLSNHFDLRAGFVYASLAAADKYNSQADLRARNLSFETRLTESSLIVDYNILNPRFHRLTPYVFGGVAIFHYNPFAYDTLGNKQYLHALSTEGEGLSAYPDRKPYALTQLALPFGAGVRWAFTDRISFGIEVGLRKTFTDYLDDVSTKYVDQSALAAAKGPVAVAMAYRGDELKNGAPYPADGSIRGGSRYKDWYYLTTFTVGISLGKLHGFHGSDNGRTDCPKPVQ